MFSFFDDITFANKELLWLLVVVPFIIGWYIYKNRTYHAEIKVSSLSGFEGLKPTIKARMWHLFIVLRTLAIVLIIIVLARPQSRSSWKDIKTEGIDIVLSLHITTSMLAKDFKPDRLEAAKV